MSEYLDKKALAAESSLGVRTWERIIHDHQIATVRIGARVLVRRSDFIAFMESRKSTPIAPTDVRAQLDAIAKRALKRKVS